SLSTPPPPNSPLFPYTTLFRSGCEYFQRGVRGDSKHSTGPADSVCAEVDVLVHRPEGIGRYGSEPMRKHGGLPHTEQPACLRMAALRISGRCSSLVASL